jgi:hypothetical protein
MTADYNKNNNKSNLHFLNHRISDNVTMEKDEMGGALSMQEMITA